MWVSHFLESCVKSCAINIWAKQPTTKQGASTITNFIPKLNFFSHLNFVGLTIALKNTIQTLQRQYQGTFLKITHLIILCLSGEATWLEKSRLLKSEDSTWLRWKVVVFYNQSMRRVCNFIVWQIKVNRFYLPKDLLIGGLQITDISTFQWQFLRPEMN